MEIPPLWKEILTKVREIYPEAIIAGGSLRDLDHGKEPKDIDIFVEDLDRPSVIHKPDIVHPVVNDRNIWARALEAVGVVPKARAKLTEAGFALTDHTTFYFHQGADRVWKTIYKDMPVEIVEMKGAYTPWSVLNRFDFGLNRIAWDGENFYVSDYYIIDKENKCVTMRASYNESHFKFLRDEKYEKRLKLKYDYPLVIPKEILNKHDISTS